MLQIDDTTPIPRRVLYNRLILTACVVLAVVLIVVVPPLVNVNHYRHRLVDSISASIGRRVYIKDVTLTAFPIPGINLKTFVVYDDPAFSNEPILRAESVRASLRLSSLWRRRIEVSTISLEEPSLNLVRNAQGKWNVESVLGNASQIEAAPTEQKGRSDAPRFPYIEATNARVNVKLGLEKMPFSLTDAEFSLWLPDPSEWRVRLEAKPVRTDTNASDTGLMRLEGTLQRSATSQRAPLDFHASWSKAQLGETSKILLGHDALWRGTLDFSADIIGSFTDATVQSHLGLNDLRRAEFLPNQTIQVNLQCSSQALNGFRSFKNIACTWPIDKSVIAIAGALPDVTTPGSASIQIGTPSVAAGVLFNVTRLFSQHINPNLSMTGTASASLTKEPGYAPVGYIDFHNASLVLPGLDPAPLKDAEIHFHNEAPPTTPHRTQSRPAAPSEIWQLDPIDLDLGAPNPAQLTATADRNGYEMHLTGNYLPANLRTLATAFPPLGNGLQAILPSQPAQTTQKPTTTPPTTVNPLHIDAVSQRQWSNPQTWITPTTAPHPIHHHEAGRVTSQ